MLRVISWVVVGMMVLVMPVFAEKTHNHELDVDKLFAACKSTAVATPSTLRPVSGHTKMWCAVVDREGKLLLIQATDTGGSPQNPMGSDAWRGSIEIAEAKAYTGMAFSSNELALDSRVIGLLARLDGPGSGPVGSDTGPAPLFGIGNTNPFRSVHGNTSDDAVGKHHRGIVTFAGGQPVYSNPGHIANCTSGGGVLLGGVGVSGDGVDEDDAVAKGAVQGAGYCLAP